MALTEELSEHFNQFQRAPFLFVGSGLSRRYIGLESWEGLLDRFSEMAGQPYQYYRASASGFMPRIASKIAFDFHEVWWKDPAYAEAREQEAKVAINNESALKIEVAKHVRNKPLEPDSPELREEFQKLREVVIDGAITTNWDMLLDSLFPDFKPFVGQQDLIFSANQEIGEIYKIHGCCSDPTSLILTENDYEDFSDKNPYLAAKLLTIFVEHPVVFLGYSLTDQNVHEILEAIVSCLSSSHLDSLRDRLIFVEWQEGLPAPTKEQSAIVIGDHNIPVTRVTVDSFLPVIDALSNFERKFPAKILRQLKEHVYHLVATNDPQNQIYVQDIDDADDLSNVDVVMGVGAIQELGNLGYRSLKRRDLIQDVLHNGPQFDAEKIINDTLPDIRRSSTYAPVHKYIREAELLDTEGNVDMYSIPESVRKLINLGEKRFLPAPTYQARAREAAKDKDGIADLVDQMGEARALYAIPLLERGLIQTDHLEQFLIENEARFLDQSNTVDRGQFIKLVCLFDYLKHG